MWSNLVVSATVWGAMSLGGPLSLCKVPYFACSLFGEFLRLLADLRIRSVFLRTLLPWQYFLRDNANPLLPWVLSAPVKSHR